MNLARPGVYAVRSNDAAAFATSTVEHWLNAEGESPLKSCLWLTAKPQAELRKFLEPHLLTRHQALKGLDVVSIRPLLETQGGSGGVRELCRSLNSLLVLKPAQVVMEHAALWFDRGDEPLEKRNPRAKIELLHRWAQHANVRVILPIEDAFSQWCVFADGLAQADTAGEVQFSPWWPAAWGFKSSLWHSPENLTNAAEHLVLNAAAFGDLCSLAKAIHRLRYSTAPDMAIHIETHNDLDEHVCSVLLRLGADTVVFDGGQVSRWLNIPQEKIRRLQADELTQNRELKNFASDLHELFMPGQLALLYSTEFAIQGLMMQDVCTRWGMHCSLTRLSLLGHMTAQTALRLANFGQAACMFTATREAVYLFKIWADPPSNADLRDWLDVCFHEKLPFIFSGDIHLLNVSEQKNLLMDLHSELEPIVFTDLRESSMTEPAGLTDVWQGVAEQVQDRPWSKRLQLLTTKITGLKA